MNGRVPTCFHESEQGERGPSKDNSLRLVLSDARYLRHVTGHNLSLLRRQRIGAGTPREAVAGGYGCIFVLMTPTGAVLVAQILIVSEDGETAFAALCFVVG